jgi:hypothetical protein
LGDVVHDCNLSCIGGKVRKIVSSRTAWSI